MKPLGKAILLFMLCSCATIAMAQRDTLLKDTVYKHLPDAREKVPLFVINDNIIGALNISPNDIKAISILKEPNIPGRLKNLGKYGVVLVTLKDGIKVPAKSLEEVKQWLGINNKVKFAVDGFYVDDATLMIGIQSIFEMNVIRDDKGSASTINIWTMAPLSRKGNPPPPPNGKPGEIYIR